jgi:uncharacterized protein YndB with AHSA1/START domain
LAVDVTVEAIIDWPRDEVARYAGDPSNAPQWYANIRSVNWRTAAPLQVGTEVDFVATFLGRRLAYTYEIVELVPGSRLVMRTSQGPFPMETTYEWEAADGRTLMRLGNRGQPSGFGRIAAPVLTAAVRRNTTNDLARLKWLLEH